MSNVLDEAFKNAMFQQEITEDVAVKAEDLQGSGIDFTKTFFEPQVGFTYLVKFLPNPGGDLITHRSVYKDLPDPDRKGKKFRYISSGSAKTCPVLELFFDLNDLKKSGDLVAEKKIEKYLSRKNQGCAKVQILSSKNREEIGQIKLLVFSTFGPNATIANLIQKKLNPTKEQIEQGFEKENIFYPFGSSVMSIVCEEGEFDGQKGRDFSKSDWAPKKRGAIGILEDGKTHEFTEADLDANGNDVKDEVKPYFEKFLEQLTREDVDVHKWFAYKTVDDPKNDHDTNEYLKSVQKKVEEIVPIIRDKSLREIANYGRAEQKSENKENNDEKPTDILKESLPEELQQTVMNEGGDAPASKKGSEDDKDIDSILNS